MNAATAPGSSSGSAGADLPVPASSARDLKRRLALSGMAALLGALLYVNSLPNQFVFDDRPIVERNAQIRSLRNLPEIFRTPYSQYFGDRGADTGLYRPLTIATFAGNYALGGLRPFGYHLVNVALHALASALVVLVALALPVPASVALAGGLLFAAHPIHTEAVANVTGRSELLAAVFFLAALLCYLRARWVWSATFFFLALLSKETAITLIGVAAAREALLAPRRPAGMRGSLRALLSLVIPVLAVLAIRASVLGSPLSPPTHIPFVDNPLVGHGIATRFLTATAVAARYAWLLVFPQHLSPDYSWAQIVPVESAADPVFLSGLALAAVSVVCLVRACRRAPEKAFLGLLALLPFALVSNFPIPIGTIMAERLLYLPSAGLCLLAGFLFPFLLARFGRPAAIAAVAVAVAALAARTVARNPDWHDGYRLFSKAAIDAPQSAKVWNNLGTERLKLDRIDEAGAAIRKARSIAPDWPNVRINLAQVYVAEGNLEAAEAEAREAVRGLPHSGLALVKLGEVLHARGKTREAIAAYRAGLALDTTDFDARLRLGRAAADVGDFETAERELLAAVDERPASVPARTSLGLVYQQRGRFEDAAAQLGEARHLLPGNVEVSNNFGNALRAAGRLDESERTLRAAVALDQRFAPSRFNLGLTLETAGKLKDARQQYLDALAIDPDHQGSLLGLARVALREGDPRGALAHLDRAVRSLAAGPETPAQPEAHALRARAFFELGLYRDAERELLRVLELDPDSVAARENLERVRSRF